LIRKAGNILTLTAILFIAYLPSVQEGSSERITTFMDDGSLDGIVHLKGEGRSLYDTHMYFGVEKGVTLSSASLKVQTVDSRTGPWIEEPSLDIGLDSEPEWSFSGPGYHTFGRAVQFGDDMSIHTKNVDSARTYELGDLVLPEGSQLHQAGLEVMGRFVPEIGSMNLVGEGGAVGYTPQGIKFGDMDGDGLNDTLISTGDPGDIYLYRQYPEGTFTPEKVGLNSTVKAFVPLDADDDGDLDMVFSNATALGWIENNGTGLKNITRISSSFTPDILLSCDLDNDGEEEVVGAYSSFSTDSVKVRVLKRDSGTSFQLWPVYKPDFSGTLKFMDTGDRLDDGYQDLYLAFADNRVRTLTNPASVLYWADDSDVEKKSAWVSYTEFTCPNSIYGFDVGDVDDDGLSDVVIAPYVYWGGGIFYYRNRCSSSSVSWTRYTISSGYVYYPRSVAIFDVDGDGIKEVAYSTGSYYWNNQIGWMNSKKNPNKSSWTMNVLMSGQTTTGVDMFSGDLNSDRHDDFGIFFRDNRQVVYWKNAKPYDGSTLTSAYVEDGGLSEIRDLAYGDIDGDLDLDLVITAYRSGTVGWFENEGNFLDEEWPFHRINDVMIGGANQVDVGDIDGDGDMDVAVSAYDSGELLWFENTAGDATAWDHHRIGDMRYAQGCALGDLDEDGKLDVVTSAGYYYGDGVKFFTADDPKKSWSSHSITTGVSYCGIVNLTDMNLDGHLDVLVPVNGWSGSANIYRNPLPSNPRTSSWQTVNAVSGLSYPWECLPLDIDDDGNLDVVATDNSGSGWGNVKWGQCPPNRNRTSGWTTYTLANMGAAGGRYPWGLAVGDVDSDGFDDVFVTCHYWWSYSYYSGYGVFWFEEPDDIYGTWDRWVVDSDMKDSWGVINCDMDGDGTPEIIAVSNGENTVEGVEPELHYPEDVQVDLGYDGTTDWSLSGTLKGTDELEIKEQLQYVIDTLPSRVSRFSDLSGNKMLRIPVMVSSGSPGKISGYDIDIRYNITMTVDNQGKVRKAIDRIIPDAPSSGQSYTRIYIGFSGSTPGKARLFDLDIEYNSPPRLKKALPDSIWVNEDSVRTGVLDLKEYFVDDYTGPELLHFEVEVLNESTPNLRALIDANGELTLDATLNEDYFGRGGIRFIVTDTGGPNKVPQRSYVTRTVQVEIRPQNDPVQRSPGGSLPDRLSGLEGEEVMVIDLNELELFYDPDDRFISSVQYYPVLDPDGVYPGDLSNVSVREEDGRIFARSTGNWWGHNIPLRIYGYNGYDGLNLNRDPYYMTMLNIRNVNDPPFWRAIPNAAGEEDEGNQHLIDLIRYVSDIDSTGDDLSIGILGHTNSTFFRVEMIEPSLGRVAVEPIVKDWCGWLTVDIMVSDGEFVDTTSFNIEIEPRNDLPTVLINNLKENSRVKSGKFSVVGNASDVEGIASVEVLFEGIWTTAQGMNSWGVTLEAPNPGRLVEHVPVRVKVTDSDGAYAFATVNITIEPRPEPVEFDIDRDGYENTVDDFPYDPSEWLDSDGDGLGDNKDAFPYRREWRYDSDKDGLADVADEYPFIPGNPLNDTTDKVNEGGGPDYTVPVILWILCLLTLTAASISGISLYGRYEAAKDPLSMIAYHNKLEERKRKFGEITQKIRLEEFLEGLQFINVNRYRGYPPMPPPAGPPVGFNNHTVMQGPAQYAPRGAPLPPPVYRNNTFPPQGREIPGGPNRSRHTMNKRG